MNLFKITILFLVFFSSSIFSQKIKNPPQKKVGFEITLHTLNLKNQKLELYLISGINKKKFVTDSVSINENAQTVTFLQPKKIINAIYYLRFKNQNKAIELAVDNGAIIDLYLENENLDQLKCKKNTINKDFIEYQQLLEQTTNARNALLSRYPKSILNLYMAAQNKIAEKNPILIEEKISYRNTFFNFLNRADKNILFLPNFTKLLYKYVTILPVTNENYIENIDLVLKYLDCKSKNYSLFSNYFTSNLAFFETNQLEKTYNYLFKNYIDKNPCDAFSASDYNTYSNKYNTNIKIPLGTITPDFEMMSKDSIAYKLSEIFPKNDYTFIAFYSPSCVHCQEKIPQVSAYFKNIKNKYPTKTIQLIGVINDLEESKWEQFIKDSNLIEWLNLKSPDSKRKYQEDFNAYSNPCFFMINKSGEVVLKTANEKAIEVIIQK